MTEKEKRMRAYSQNRFAALETALYLDTHPTDRKALAAFRTYAEEAAMCGRGFPVRGRGNEKGR